MINLFLAVEMFLAAWVHWTGYGGLAATRIAHDLHMPQQTQAVIYCALALALVVQRRGFAVYVLAMMWFLLHVITVLVLVLESCGGYMTAVRTGALWIAMVLLAVGPYIDGECPREQ